MLSLSHNNYILLRADAQSVKHSKQFIKKLTYYLFLFFFFFFSMCFAELAILYSTLDHFKSLRCLRCYSPGPDYIAVHLSARGDLNQHLNFSAQVMSKYSNYVKGLCTSRKQLTVILHGKNPDQHNTTQHNKKQCNAKQWNTSVLAVEAEGRSRP